MKEGGSGVFATSDEPASGDIESVQTGLLEIIRLADLTHLDRDGQWRPAERGVLFTKEQHPEIEMPTHYPAHHFDRA